MPPRKKRERAASDVAAIDGARNRSAQRSGRDWSVERIRRPKSLTTMVANEIRDLIVAGEIELGALISENDLADRLGVSRTPVREALQKLDLERLVEIVPQRGTFVFQFNEAEIEHTCEMREILEAGALRLAVRRNRRSLLAQLDKNLADGEAALDQNADAFREIDAGFHATLVEASDNRDLIDAYERISSRVRSLLNRLARSEIELAGSQRDHRTIVEEIRRGDDSAAETALRWHINGLPRLYAEKFHSKGQ